MAQHINSHGERIVLGALGGFTPVLLNLALVDTGTVFENLTAPAAVGYFVRVGALVALGALVGWLHEDERKRVRVFELGLAAPAILMGVMNGVALRADRGQLVAIDLGTPVHAAQQVETFEPAEETGKQQVLRGLLGVKPALAEWIVEVYGGDRQDALRRARALQQRHPGLAFKVFQPSAGMDQWVVSVGGQMTQAAATRQLEEARELRVRGAKLRRIPRTE